MQIATTSTTPLPIRASSTCSSASLVVFTAVDDVLRDRRTLSTARTRTALQLLAARQVPVVLVSALPADDLMALQRQTGSDPRPFIAGGGAELYIPRGYFRQVMRFGTDRGDWHVVEFKEPLNQGPAVRLLISLFRLCAQEVTIVGLCDTWDDRVLLQHADVPVVVRTGNADEAALLRAVPSASLTMAVGPAGWSEAILGSLRG